MEIQCKPGRQATCLKLAWGGLWHDVVVLDGVSGDDLATLHAAGDPIIRGDRRFPSMLGPVEDQGYGAGLTGLVQVQGWEEEGHAGIFDDDYP